MKYWVIYLLALFCLIMFFVNGGKTGTILSLAWQINFWGIILLGEITKRRK